MRGLCNFRLDYFAVTVIVKIQAMNKKYIACLLAPAIGSLALFLAGCSTVPVTGRSALNLVSDEYVERVSIQEFQMLMAMTPQSRSRKLHAAVKRVGEKIAEAASADLSVKEWEFVVFQDDSSINAFAMAGGKVGVFTGLFKVAQSDADLAVVLAHEIAHVAAKHINERLSQQKLMGIGQLGLLIGTSGQGRMAQGAVLNAYGLGTQLGVALPFNRGMETEADYIGLMYMARAGYDPNVVIDFWLRLDAESAGQPTPPEFLSTHPSHATRMQHLREILPQAVSEYEYYKNLQYLK